MAKPGGTKLLYINNLRILLIIMIVMLHIAITYGAAGMWYYKEPTNDVATAVVLTLYNAVTQAFALGFFFMISGYFTPGSYDRKGARRFLQDRFKRLGIPLLLYYFVINPLIVWVIYGHLKGEKIPIASLFGTGPLWFVQVLLMFAIAYAVYRAIPRFQEITASQKKAPGHKEILIFAALLSLANYVTRMAFPIEKTISNLQFAFSPGYISLFIVGTVAFKYHWFDDFSEGVGRRWLVISGSSIILLPVLMIAGGALEDLSPFLGGPGWQSFALSTWEAFVGTGMIAGLFVLFRKRFDHQGRLAKTMADNVYAVYVIHAPVIVFFAYSLRFLKIYPMAKFVMVSLFGVSLCFLISRYVIRRFPFADKVL